MKILSRCAVILALSVGVSAEASWLSSFIKNMVDPTVKTSHYDRAYNEAERNPESYLSIESKTEMVGEALMSLEDGYYYAGDEGKSTVMQTAEIDFGEKAVKMRSKQVFQSDSGMRAPQDRKISLRITEDLSQIEWSSNNSGDWTPLRNAVSRDGGNRVTTSGNEFSRLVMLFRDNTAADDDQDSDRGVREGAQHKMSITQSSVSCARVSSGVSCKLNMVVEMSLVAFIGRDERKELEDNFEAEARFVFSDLLW